MFGGDLAETVKYESRKGGGFVPIVIDRCIERIRDDGEYLLGKYINRLRVNGWLTIVCIFPGLDEEGLFRLPGNMKITGELKAAFNKGTMDNSIIINIFFLPHSSKPVISNITLKKKENMIHPFRAW